MSRESVVTLALLLVIGVVALYIERRRLSVKEIALIAALSAIAALGRIPFAAIPGVQPTTFLVLVSGAVFGPSIGFLVGALAAISSNMFLGQGPWTVFQVIAWGGCGATAGCLFANSKAPNRVSLLVFALCWGFLFGWIMNLWHWLMFVHPLNLRSWIALNVTSVYFDAMHAAGNVLLVWIAGDDVIAALRRFKKRMVFTIENEDMNCEPQLRREQRT